MEEIKQEHLKCEKCGEKVEDFYFVQGIGKKLCLECTLGKEDDSYEAPPKKK